MDNLKDGIILDELLSQAPIYHNICGLLTLLLDSPHTQSDTPTRSTRTEKTKQTKEVKNHWDDKIPNMSLDEFKSHFMMSRGAFEVLLTELNPLMKKKAYVTLEKKVLLTIWILAKPETYLAASSRFGLSKGSAHYILLEVVSAIIQLKSTYICWPNQNEMKSISERCEQQCGIPGIVGAIDACHINIKKQTYNAANFNNRKNECSVILQAVCDDTLKFTDIFVGMPGSMEDYQVFENSPIFEKLSDDPPLLTYHQHVVCDNGYPLMVNLLKPYLNRGYLRSKKALFNEKLNSQLSLIGKAFAMLKGKWERLKFLDMTLEDQISNVITACCILHNFILKTDGGELDCEFAVSTTDNSDYEIQHEDQSAATTKRDYIASLIV